MIVKLSKPFKVGDKVYEEITLAFDALTGEDVLAAERKAMVAGGGMPVLNMRTSGQLHSQLAAAASGIDSDALVKLPAGDFVSLLDAVQSFLIASG